jgi:hypothetical protein
VVPCRRGLRSAPTGTVDERCGFHDVFRPDLLTPRAPGADPDAPLADRSHCSLLAPCDCPAGVHQRMPSLARRSSGRRAGHDSCWANPSVDLPLPDLNDWTHIAVLTSAMARSATTLPDEDRAGARESRS